MRALIWILAILALLILLLFLLRLRLTGEYGESGAGLTVSLGGLPLFRLPRPEAAKQDKKGSKPKAKKKKKKKTEKKEEPKGGSEPGFRKELEIIVRFLGKLRRRLVIDELTLRYLSAGDDPAATALAFGAANAAAAALARAVESVFRVKKRDIRAAVSFTEPKPRVYARLQLSVSLGILIWILGKAALERTWAKLTRTRK